MKLSADESEKLLKWCEALASISNKVKTNHDRFNQLIANLRRTIETAMIEKWSEKKLSTEFEVLETSALALLATEEYKLWKKCAVDFVKIFFAKFKL